MTPQKLPPLSGFTSPEFWFSFLTLIATFALNQWGISASFIQSLPGGNGWLPILAAVIIGAFIIIKTFIRTRNSERDLPASQQIDIKSRGPFQTSEFWLGLTAIGIKVLQENKVAGTDISTSVTTTFLILAVVYALARSQLKQAYLDALLMKLTDPSGPTGKVKQGIIPILHR